MKSLNLVNIALACFLVVGCNSPSSDKINAAVSGNVLKYGADKFKLVSVKTVKENKQKVEVAGIKLETVNYLVDAYIEPKEDCFTESPAQKEVQFAPLCFSKKELDKALATDRSQVRTIAAAFDWAEARKADKEHPIKPGTQLVIKNVHVECGYDHSASNPAWDCRSQRSR